MLPQLKPLTPVVTRRVTSSSWPEYSISNIQSPLSSKCFRYSCCVTHYACFYVMQAVKMFDFIELLQLAVHNIKNGFLAPVIGCCFIYDHNFTISCDDLMKKVRRSYDDVMINL